MATEVYVSAIADRNRDDFAQVTADASGRLLDFRTSRNSHMASTSVAPAQVQPRLKRSLKLWHVVVIGIVMIQPIAPMGIYGGISNKAGGHVVTAILVAMVAMLFTAISYGRMARAYPSAGSAYTYVGQEIHPALGYVTGWSMVMDYVLNPLICTVLCSKLMQNWLPGAPYWVLAIFFAALFTALNLRGIKSSARINEVMAAAMTLVVVVFLYYVVKHIAGLGMYPDGYFTRPFYNAETFDLAGLKVGTSLAVLTYIGFDGVSTMSEEVENPRRNILIATVLVCVVTGVLSSIEVYAAQLVWGSKPFSPVTVDTAFPHIAGIIGGQRLFDLLNGTILVANIGSGMAAQLAAARLLYGMGRSDAIPRGFFGAVEGKRCIPRNNVLLVGAAALMGALALEYFGRMVGDTAYQLGAQMLNFGAFIAFMGVNAAAFMRYFVRGRRSVGNLLPPVLGFLICGYIWFGLSTPAKIVGAIWVALGVLYGAVKTRGFRSELVRFDMPAEG